MAIINLRDYYPFYTSDCFMEVSDEVAEMFKEFDRKEAAYSGLCKYDGAVSRVRCRVCIIHGKV